MGNTESLGSSLDEFWSNTVEIPAVQEARSSSTNNNNNNNFWDIDYDGVLNVLQHPSPYTYHQGHEELEEEEQQQQQQQQHHEDSSSQGPGHVNTTTTAAPASPQIIPSKMKENKVESEVAPASSTSIPFQAETAPPPAPPLGPAPAPSPSEPAGVAPRSVPMPTTDVEASGPSAQDEISASEAAAASLSAASGTDLNISKIQASNPAPPDAKLASGGAIARVRSLYRAPKRAPDPYFMIIFLIQLASTAVVIIFFAIRYLKLHNFRRWFPQLSVAIATGLVFGLLCQGLFSVKPRLMSLSIVWISALLTFGAAVMLISTSLPANLGVGIAFLIFSVCQSLYACWISNRVKYAGKLLHYCLLKTAKEISGIYFSSFCVTLLASLWVLFWSFGVVTALSVPFAPLIILALLATLAWTLETLRNVVCASTARRVAAVYLDKPPISGSQSLSAAFSTWFGSICMGSLFVPTLHILRVMARGLNRIHTENEFMFSCAGCFYNITNKCSKYANNWAYVQVAVHNKHFFKASYDTIKLFENKRLDKVIEKDLTSSFCVLSGISGGMLCVLVSGGWTFGIYKPLTSSISVVSFCIGYFLVRIMMAVPHGVASAHYVCYGENPSGPQFATSPVHERLKDLLAEEDAEAAKQG